jgi:hypothetical protein
MLLQATLDPDSPFCQTPAPLVWVTDSVYGRNAMNRHSRRWWIALLVCVAVGCSENPPAEPAGPEFPSDPAARAAYEFLDAVLKGDSQRASGRLSPLAMQRIVESGKQFSPPGLETASFRVGEVRQHPTSPARALVQCILTDTSTPGEPREEEICCLMRLVDNQWCVSGIAYSAGADKPPMILDFENPQSAPAQSQSMAEGGSPGSAPASTQPDRASPPRTAQDPAYPVAR